MSGDMTDRFREWFNDTIVYWFIEPPDPEGNPDDNIWHDFHLFDGEWINIQNRLEWYESPNVPNIYKDHKYIMEQNLEFSRPEETFYKQNLDSNSFKSDLDSRKDLPSGRGEMRLKVAISTKIPPSGENDFAMVQYVVDTEIKYDIPKGITFLPRFIANPINRMFKYTFLRYIGEEMVEYDGEFAIEETRNYFQYLRKYHGEEPVQTKSRQANFKPMPEEGTFFQ